MDALKERKCVPCEGGVRPLDAKQAGGMMKLLHADWKLVEDGKAIRRELKFPDFWRTMSFVNALAHIANVEDHHPDLEVGYNYCRIRYSTHAIGGLSDNDFICAAGKADARGRSSSKDPGSMRHIAASSLPPRSAPYSSGTTFTCTARSPSSFRRSSFRRAMRRRPSSRALQPSARVSPCGRSAHWSSGASAT